MRWEKGLDIASEATGCAFVLSIGHHSKGRYRRTSQVILAWDYPGVQRRVWSRFTQRAVKYQCVRLASLRKIRSSGVVPNSGCARPPPHQVMGLGAVASNDYFVSAERNSWHDDSTNAHAGEPPTLRSVHMLFVSSPVFLAACGTDRRYESVAVSDRPTHSCLEVAGQQAQLERRIGGATGDL